MARDCVAVDLDGTLIDAQARHCALTAWCLSVRGLGQIDLLTHWQLKREGFSTLDALREAGVGAIDAAAVAELWRQRVEDRGWLAFDRVLPGVQAALLAHRLSACAMPLITARQRTGHLEWQLERLGLRGALGAICVVDPMDAVSQKADCLRRLGATGFVGDTEADARAAAAAGVEFVAVTTGLRSRSFLEALGVESVSDLGSAIACLRMDDVQPM